MSPHESGGRFYCLKCGHNHNRNSDTGAFHHSRFDEANSGMGLDEDDLAVGVAIVDASLGRRYTEATLDEIETSFEELGFGAQFPDLDVAERVHEFVDDSVLSDDRYSGKRWFGILDSQYEKDIGVSPERFRLRARAVHNELERTRVR